MASAFKTATSASIGTSLTTVYTCPSSTTSTIIGLYLCNQSGGAIEANVLEAGDIIKVQSNTASSIDVVLSYLEQT